VELAFCSRTIRATFKKLPKFGDLRLIGSRKNRWIGKGWHKRNRYNCNHSSMGFGRTDYAATDASSTRMRRITALLLTSKPPTR
jgi:hypothetical protein